MNNGFPIDWEFLRAATPSGGGSIAPEKHHPIDDEALLYDWSVGDLDAARHRRVLDHLASCSDCRKELACMIRVGALTFSWQADAGPADSEDEASSAGEARFFFRKARASLDDKSLKKQIERLGADE